MIKKILSKLKPKPFSEKKTVEIISKKLADKSTQDLLLGVIFPKF